MRFEEDKSETQTSQNANTILSEQVRDLEMDNMELRLALEAAKSESVYPIILRHLTDKIAELEKSLAEYTATTSSYQVDGEGKQVTESVLETP